MNNVLYMEVTKDKYELPVAVADSAAALARLVGVGKSSISQCMCHTKKYGGKCKYIKVVLEDEEDEEDGN